MKTRDSNGFSLIELTVVIVLMASLAGLVAPLTYRQLEKSKAKTEYLVFRNTLKALCTKAFAQGLSYEIKMSANGFTTRSVLSQHDYQFEYLNLPAQQFYINRNGYPSVDSIKVDMAGTQRELLMMDILGVKQELIHANNK